MAVTNTWSLFGCVKPFDSAVGLVSKTDESLEKGIAYITGN